MRISTKGRYGLAVMIKLGEKRNSFIAISTLSSELGLSKIYLEQVLSLLKNGGLVSSSKGPQGGYMLTSYTLTVKDILIVLEPALFETVEAASGDSLMNQIVVNRIFDPAQMKVCEVFANITLESLVSEVLERRMETPMFYI